MANSDKDILITPNTGSSSADPKIEYVGADSSGNDTITVETLYDGTKATLSFEGSAGQLFSVVNDLSSDPIFSVNDVSGIPSIEVDSDGEIRLAEFSGNVGIGTGSPGALLDVNDENAVSRIRISRGGTDLSTSTDIGSLDFYADYSSSPIHYGGLKAYANNLSGVRGSLDFYVKSTSGNVLTGMTLYGTNSGVNVGIGTLTPSSLLDVDGRITANNLTLQNLSAQNSEATAVMIDGSGIIGTRELGSNAFNSTSYLTGNQTITLSGDVSGSGTTSISVTVADDSHNHIISNVDGLQTALDGKLSTSGTAANSQLLDSLDSSQFLRSDATDTASGVITFSGDMFAKNVVFVGGSSYNENIRCHPSSGNDYSSLVLGAVSGNSGTGTGQWTLVRYPAATHSNKFSIRHNSSDLMTILTNGNIYHGSSNLIWHAGNDGANSGLDADLLDAQHGSYYLDYNNFTNTPTIPSLSGYATESYVNTQVSNLVDSAPGTLDTLNELAAALGDDANFSTTVTNSIATKLPLSGGILTGDLQAPGLYVGSTNTSYDFYNNGTTYLNGNVRVNATLTVDAGNIEISKNNPVLILSDTSSTSNADQVAYISFQDNGSEEAWIGWGSSGNSDFTIKNNIGSVVLDGNGTTVINDNLDLNGNADISGTISSGAISSTGQLTLTQSSGNNILYINSSGGGNPVIYMEDSNRKWGLFVASSNLHFKDENANINALIISAGGNATFSGTISSGAITSSGNLTVNSQLIKISNTSGQSDLRFEAANNNFSQVLFGDTDGTSRGTIRYKHDTDSFFIAAGGITNSDLEITNTAVNVTGGNLQISGTTIVDSSRNITNIVGGEIGNSTDSRGILTLNHSTTNTTTNGAGTGADITDGNRALTLNNPNNNGTASNYVALSFNLNPTTTAYRCMADIKLLRTNTNSSVSDFVFTQKHSDGVFYNNLVINSGGDISTRGDINLADGKDITLGTSDTANGKINLGRGGYITFYGDDNTHHSIGSRDNAGNITDDLTISSYGAVYIDLDSNNNNTSAADFIIASHGSTTPLYTLSGETGDATFTGNITNTGLIDNNYTGTGIHTLQNSTSNGTVLNLTSTGDSRVLSLQTDHIYSNGSLYLGDNSYATNYRGSSHNFSTGSLYIPGAIIHEGDTDTYIQFNDTNSWRVFAGNSERLKCNTTGVIINDNSGDMDFRVESNNNDAMIFVDGGNDKVSIGTSDTASMDARFTVQGSTIGNTSGDTALHTTIAGSRHHLDFEEERTASTSDWQNTTYRLGMRVDTTDHQAIEFVSDGSSNEHIDIRTGNRVFNTRFNANGNVGIGTQSPSQKLDVQGTILVNNEIQFVNDAVRIYRSSDELRFRTGSADRSRIDSSGNFMVNKTTIGVANVGSELRADGLMSATRSGANVLYLNRTASDGNIIELRQDNVAIGVLGVDSSDNLYIAGSAGGTHGLYFDDTSVLPTAQGGARESGTMTLGSSTYKFANLYLSGSANATSLNINGQQVINSSRQMLNLSTITSGAHTINGSANNPYMTFNVSGVTRGRIGVTDTTTSNIYFSNSASSSSGIGLKITGFTNVNNISPCYGNGTATNNLTDLGASGTRWKNIYAGSNIYAGADVVAYSSSDERLKDNLERIQQPIEKIQKISGYEFDWNDNQDTFEGHDIGVVAQEVEKVLPEIVETRENGYKAVKYEKMVALLIEGMKEQQEQIKELQEQVQELSKQK